MKSKQLLILGAVFLVLIAIVLVSRTARRGPQTEIKEDTLIEEFEPGQVGYIEFYHGAKPAVKVVLEKKGETWVVPSRYGARADTERINNLLNDLPRLGGEARVRELSLFGEFDITEEQAIHLLVKDTGGSEITHLLIGKAGPDWRSSFVRKAGGNAVCLVNVSLLSRLGISRPKTGPVTGVDEARWLDLTILPDTDADKVTALHLRSPQKELSFERAADGSGVVKEKSGEKGPWKLTTPGIDYPVKERGITALLRGLVNRRAEDVADPAKEAQYGFEDAQYVATLTFEDKSEKKIVVGKEFERDKRKCFYLKVGDEALPFAVAQYVVDRLFEDAGKLLELKVLDIPEKEARLITLSALGKKTILERDEKGRWTVSEPELPFKERKDAAKRLLEKFLRFEPDDLLNLRDTGQVWVTVYYAYLQLADGGKKEIGFSQEIAGTDGERYASVTGERSTFSVSKHTFGQLFPSLITLFDVSFADLDREALSTVEVERDGQKFVLRKDDEDKWQLEVFGYTFNADKKKVTDIVNYFTRVRPTEVLGKVELKEYGLDKPVVTVKVDNGKDTATIIVSSKKDKDDTRHYAADAESGIVFTIVDKAVEAANVKLSTLATLRIFPTSGEPDFLKIRGAIEKTGANLEARQEERDKEGKKVKVWVTPEGKELDANQVRRLISKVRALLATDISAGSLMRGKPEVISLGLDGKRHGLSLDLISKDAKDKTYRCQLWDRKGLLLVRESLLEPIFKLAAKIGESPKIKEPDKEKQEEKKKEPPEEKPKGPEDEGK